MEYKRSPKERVAHMKHEEKAEHENPFVYLGASVSEGKHINRCTDNRAGC
jgi:hypothetical protein